jgi:hypothetical protein
MTQPQAVQNMRARFSGAPNLNSGAGVRLLQAAPAAIGAEMRTFMEFVPSPYRNRYRDAIRIRGREWLGPVIVPANAVAGTTLRNDYVAPQEFADSRLAQFGQLYEKFLFQRLEWEYTPSVGSSQAGSILLAYDRDISDPTPPATTQGIRQFLSWEDSVEGNVWAPHACRAKLEQPETGFFTDNATGGDDRLAYQGQSYVALVDPCGNGSPLLIGNVSVVYELDLFVPQLQTPIVTAKVGNVVTAPTAADAFLPYVKTAAGFVQTLATVGSQLLPQFTPANVTAAVKAVEGTYRLLTTAVQAGAGAVDLAPPVLTPIEPIPATSPQPVTRLLNFYTSAVAGDLAYEDWLLAVPKGGAYITQGYTTFTGGVNAGTFTIDKVAPYVADLTSIF